MLFSNSSESKVNRTDWTISYTAFRKMKNLSRTWTSPFFCQHRSKTNEMLKKVKKYVAADSTKIILEGSILGGQKALNSLLIFTISLK